MKAEKPRNFDEFWPMYVSFHSHPLNRRMHFVGSALSLVFFALAFVLGQPWYLLGAPIMGYGFAWVGHFLVEGNKPATFNAPIFSFIGDWKMFFLMLSGKMDAELERVRKSSKP